MNAIVRYRQALDDYKKGLITAHELRLFGDEMRKYLEEQRKRVRNLIYEIQQVYTNNRI
jgi:hypothetical protein